MILPAAEEFIDIIFCDSYNRIIILRKRADYEERIPAYSYICFS